MRLSVLLCAITCALTLASFSQAQAQTPLYDEVSRSTQKNLWQFDFQTTYYQATANYTQGGGKYVELPSGDSYHLLDFDFGIRWSPTARWGLYTSTRVSNAESKDLLNTRTNSSVTQAVVGTDFQWLSAKNYNIYPDFSVTIPFSRVDANSDEVLNSEGAMEVTGKLVGRLKWGRVYPFAFAGFTYRDEDRSSLLPYGAGAEMHFSDWAIGGEVRGYQTVMNDKYTDDPLKREIVAARDGGSLRYFSVNPSLLETNFWYRTRLMGSWGVKVGAGTSITGSSTSAGLNVIAGLSYALKGADLKLSQPVHDPEVRDFKEEVDDGVDQSLFTPPPPPPPVKPVDPKKRLQKELDQTEFQIELKRPKKK